MNMTVEQFYGGDPAERRVHPGQMPKQRARYYSPEKDFGVWWIRGTAPWPRYRVTWVKDTGEVYCYRLAGWASDPWDGAIEILGGVAEEPELERRLAGWEDKCGEDNGLEWIQRRLA
jgi:hypothetical protein